MTISASKLRQDIFRILDSVLKTGEPAEILKNGQILKIIPGDKRKKLSNLKERTYSDEPLSSFDHIDWSLEWKGHEGYF